MSAHHKFEIQLENLRNEAGSAARYIYAEMAIQHAASKSEPLLNRLNQTPTFWIACGAAFQSAAYMCLGRIFDKTSRFNVAALLDTFEADLSLFQRSALGERKLKLVGSHANAPWLPEYLDRAYYPSKREVATIRKKVDAHRRIYDRVVKPPRNKYLAHREKQDREEVGALFAGGTTKELWRLTTFLLQLHEVLWELLHNGSKPRFRAIRYSVKTIFDSDSQSSLPHESIVRETKTLMAFLATTPTARPNE